MSKSLLNEAWLNRRQIVAAAEAYIKVTDTVKFLDGEANELIGTVREITSIKGVLTYKIFHVGSPKIHTVEASLVEKIAAK